MVKRIGILTAGGDTPALNATIYGAVEQANRYGIEVYGICKGFGGMLDPRMPHVVLNPLFSTIPELDATQGGTILGSSRTYIDAESNHEMKEVAGRLRELAIEGLICIGGDGTINGMQPLTEFFPCVLAPKTIDNDLGLNHVDEPNEWTRRDGNDPESCVHEPQRDTIELEDIVNYATPGYATAVFVVAQSIQRIRTTAESHRRIGIVEVMGRQSGYIALGSAYGQPDIILVPEVPLNLDAVERRVRELYELQKNVVIVVGEGIVDESGRMLGAESTKRDPSGKPIFSGAAYELQQLLAARLGDAYFRNLRRHETAKEAIFTRKVGHTQRGGRPVTFDRFYATQLGGHAVEMLVRGQTNSVAVLEYDHQNGFFVDDLPANKLRDRWGAIHPRDLHPSMYDPDRFRPSRFGVCYLQPIFTNAVGADDVEHVRSSLFDPGHLTTRYQSVNIDVHKRIRYM